MPIITTAVLTALATSLAEKGLESIVKTTGKGVTEGALDWFKSLFKKSNNEPKKILTELTENPDKEDSISKAVAIIENSIEDNPQFEEYLKSIIDNNPTISLNISDSKNVNTGNVNTRGGDFRIGDDVNK